MNSKFYSLIFLLFVTATAIAQDLRIIDSQEYDLLKKTNQLPAKFLMKKTEGSQTVLMPRIQPSVNSVLSNVTCNCLLPLDPSYDVVPFTNGSGPEYRNDDGSSPLITLPFTFCFFGQQGNSVYINNNGNLSLDRAVGAYSAGGFPAGTDTVMIAPFWADVDTRNVGSGLVYYKVTATSLIV